MNDIAKLVLQLADEKSEIDAAQAKVDSYKKDWALRMKAIQDVCKHGRKEIRKTNTDTYLQEKKVCAICGKEITLTIKYIT
jgi:hypothetical protein